MTIDEESVNSIGRAQPLPRRDGRAHASLRRERRGLHLNVDELAPPRGFFLVARSEGHLAGGVGVRPIGDPAASRGRGQAAVGTTGPTSPRRRRRLMSALDERARTRATRSSTSRRVTRNPRRSPCTEARLGRVASSPREPSPTPTPTDSPRSLGETFVEPRRGGPRASPAPDRRARKPGGPVVATGYRDHGHRGGLRRQHASGGVLKDETLLRRDTERGRGGQERRRGGACRTARTRPSAATAKRPGVQSAPDTARSGRWAWTTPTRGDHAPRQVDRPQRSREQASLGLDELAHAPKQSRDHVVAGSVRATGSSRTRTRRPRRRTSPWWCALAVPRRHAQLAEDLDLRPMPQDLGVDEQSVHVKEGRAQRTEHHYTRRTTVAAWRCDPSKRATSRR